MLSNRHRRARVFLFACLLSGCFSSGETEIEGCGATPKSVAMTLEDRYALGATTTLRVHGLDNPQVVSSNPEVVRVGPIRDEEVTLEFVAVGTASITVHEGAELVFAAAEESTDSATAEVEVAEVEHFEILLPGTFDNPALPLAGRAVINPSFQVVYFDRVGRLYGRGLAETSWEASVWAGAGDEFQNPSLEPGPQQVEVRVGDRVSVIDFEVVAQEDVVALEILETVSLRSRVRVDAVGLTESGTQVWNIVPYFEVDDDIFFGTFEYVLDRTADPSILTAQSLVLSVNGPLDPARKEIYRAKPEDDKATHAVAASTGGQLPLMAITSLLLMTVAMRVGSRLPVY